MLCNLCNCSVHIKCNDLNRDDYETFKKSPAHLNFICFQCNIATFPFMPLNNEQFNTYITKGVPLNEDSHLSINPSREQKAIMDKIINQIKSYKFEVKDDDDNDDDFEEFNNCKYYSVELGP